MEHGASLDEIAVAVDAAGGPSPISLSAQPIIHHAVASATAGIWRFACEDWSVVLKVLSDQPGGHSNWQSGAEPGHWYYWRREALAYSSGLVAHFDGPLRSPHCYGVFDRPDGSIGVWLEDLSRAAPTASWSPGDYRSAASALGWAQGALAASKLPADPWLARQWLRRYVERREQFVAYLDDDQVWALPLVARHLPADLGEAAMEIWNGRERLLGITESGPRTLCHLDLHPANLFAANGETVLIDWAFAGIGGLGEDSGNLIFDAVFDFFVPPERFGALAKAVTEGYLEGLSASGWAGDGDAVVRTMHAAAAVKFFWIVPAMLNAVASGYELLNGRPIEETISRWAPVMPELIRLAHQV